MITPPRSSRDGSSRVPSGTSARSAAGDRLAGPGLVTLGALLAVLIRLLP